ncbi:MAG: adenylate/guanylate cyclase domain-containing protein [Solirubrobacterales bacterium]|nr:adenylate/guanylate cyclase domain-containing protein [Solirubrobacterales bacterium]
MDLVGYTALTDERGDEAAAALAREFRRTTGALCREHGATQVKSMGDGVMIWAPDPAAAIALAAAVVERVGGRPDLLPVRIGVHTGSAVMRGCDWYGAAVNVAARLSRQAEPNQALVSAATREAAGGAGDALSGCAELELRGVRRPVSVWRLA